MDKLKQIEETIQNILNSMVAHKDVNGIGMFSSLEMDMLQEKVESIQKDIKELQKIQNYTNASASPSKGESKKVTLNGEAVNHPLHYQGLTVNGTNVECIDAMESLKGWFKTTIFCELNAFKYNWRTGNKDTIHQELGKIGWYGNKAQELWKNNLNWFYPKNKHYYALVDIGTIRMKNPTTGEWVNAYLYTDGKGLYVRESEDFNNKFKYDK